MIATRNIIRQLLALGVEPDPVRPQGCTPIGGPSCVLFDTFARHTGSRGASPEATPEPKQKHKSNRLMRGVDTAVGPRERKPRRRKVPSPAST
jgi:hypothetical protein